jgi:uncharacterized protein (DUF2147 family)
MNRLASIALLGLAASPLLIEAQSSPLLGNWREPTGTILRIEPCSNDLCVRIVFLRPDAPSTVDINNPDASQRGHFLCGLVIGSQFHLTEPGRASGGSLYDPKSGNTYHGTMSVEGETLKLRGYIGFPIFGRTETWQRAPESFSPCKTHPVN